MSRKLYKYNKIDEYQKLLLTDNIKLNDDIISISKKKSKKNFCIPCRFINYNNNNSLIKIVIDIDYNDILLKYNIYKCEKDLLNVVEEFCYEYWISFWKEKNKIN